MAPRYLVITRRPPEINEHREGGSLPLTLTLTTLNPDLDDRPMGWTTSP